ncbi:hypothetical protein [Mycolicibacterium llatzerense]|uniref:hypothetical protein n=1 Tax=Mycolicibacterium llatzerense TaxID=280871 RepID=UPI0008DD7F49|nr:hypothetical protein [Mycolicibacterium llatzerense]
MSGEGLASLQAFFGRRFILGTLAPVITFVAASTALYLTGTHTAAKSLKSFAALPGASQAVLGVVALVVVAAAAQIIANFHLPLTKLYEGYWPHHRLFVGARNWAMRRQRTRWRKLISAESVARAGGNDYDANDLQLRLSVQFPPATQPQALMPTRLGNVLRAAELYPHERYAIDSVVIWPRLVPVLPPHVAVGIEERQTALESLLFIRTLSAGFGVLAPVALAIGRAPLWLLAASLLAWAVSALSYRAALQSAVAYGDLIRACFDLHRRALLTQLGMPHPPTPQAERVVWDDLTQFYLRNLPMDFESDASSSPALDEAGGPG